VVCRLAAAACFDCLRGHVLPPQVAAHGWLAETLYGFSALFLMVTAFSGIAALRMRQMIQQSNQQEFEITPAGISRRYPGQPEMFVPIEDVVRVSPGRNGLLWLRKNPHLLNVPANIENLDGFRQELIALGVMEHVMPTRPIQKLPVFLKLLAIVVLPAVACGILFFGKNPIHVGVAGIGLVAFLTWSGYRSSNNPYAGRQPRQWMWLVLAALWIFVVAMRVEQIVHPHAAVPAPCANEPSSPGRKQ
jgi:hypothetical protein